MDGRLAGFVDDDGTEWQTSLEKAAQVPLEWCSPVRTSGSYRDQRNWPGLWWSATNGGHVGYESWLERDHVMLLDFDPEVVAFAPRPFWFLFGDGEHRHAPDFFARRRDGSAVVLDCHTDRKVKPADAAAFEVTARACATVGWDYRRVGPVDAVLAGNVRWLAGYRHPRFADPTVTDRLHHIFATPQPLLAGAERAGTSMAVLPVLFHLLWRHDLTVDVSTTLTQTSTVWT